jgi:hypothetical protein
MENVLALRHNFNLFFIFERFKTNGAVFKPLKRVLLFTLNKVLCEIVTGFNFVQMRPQLVSDHRFLSPSNVLV